MGTPHPSDRERQAIQRHADQGDESAKKYIGLLNACIQVLNGSYGISIARDTIGADGDVYGGAIDDALIELMPTIYTCANGWENLRYYVSGVELEGEKDEEAGQDVQERGRENQTIQALKALDALYHSSYGEALERYEQERERLERQLRPLGFTLSYAECGDAGAGAERYNHGGMRHVLLPL